MSEEDYDLALSDPEDEDLEDAPSVSQTPPEVLLSPEATETLTETEPFIGTEMISASDEALASERSAREAAEEKIKELEQEKASSFARFKSILQEAIRQRDEARSTITELQSQLKSSQEQKNEVIHLRDSLKQEFEQAIAILASETQRIASKASSSSSNSSSYASALPQGLPAIVHVVKKRFEPLIDSLIKERDEAREKCESEVMQAAMDVSRLEESLRSLAEEKKEKEKVAEGELKKAAALLEEHRRAGEEARQKLRDAEGAALELRGAAAAMDSKLASLEEALQRERLGRGEAEAIAEEARKRAREAEAEVAHWEEREGSWKAHLAELEAEKAKVTEEIERLRVGESVESVERRREVEEMAGKVKEMETASTNLDREIQSLKAELAQTCKDLGKSSDTVKALEKDVEDLRASGRQAEAREEVALNEVMRIRESLADVEEESARWRAAASEEAAAGAIVLEELEAANEQIAELQADVSLWMKTCEDLNLKIKSKEEMASAAITAREAAEKSLLVLERRAMELRERMEDLTQQLEANRQLGDNREQVGCLTAAWPWIMSAAPQLQTIRLGRSRAGAPIVAEMEDLRENLI